MIGGYELGRHPAVIGIAAAVDGTPLYYQDPSGKPDYSPIPKKDAEGRDYVPVYDEPGAATASTPAPSAPAAASGGERKLLYYRNPMGLPDTSPVPKKDSMGMDYIPVYADEGSGTVPGTVAISPERIQMLGVRTEAASLRSIAHTVRAVGTVAADESRIGVVNPKFEGWIEKLLVNTTGQTVRRGDALLEVYSPDLVLAQREYLVARAAAADMAQADAIARDNAKAIAAAALSRLKNGDISADQLTRLQRTGTPKAPSEAAPPELLAQADLDATVRIAAPAESATVVGVPGSAGLDTAKTQTVLVDRGEGRSLPRMVKLAPCGWGCAAVLGR